MKKILLSLAVGAVLGVSTMQVSCIGSFKLTNNLYDWNSNIGSKFVNELVFFLFIIVPVYEVTLLVDGIVLNAVEFWSGSNPIAMLPGQEEIQIAEKDGIKYQIKATHNRFDIEQLEGPSKGEKCALVFNDEKQTWSLEGSKGKRELMKILKNGQAVAFMPDGTTVPMEQLHAPALDAMATFAVK